MKKGIFSILAMLAVFAMVTLGCTVDPDPEAQTNTDATLVSVLADGVRDMSTTTELYLSFSKAIDGLTKDDISWTGTDEVKGETLTKNKDNDLLYTLKISGVTGNAILNVAVKKPGDPDNNIPGSGKQVQIYYKTPAPGDKSVTLDTVTANGSVTETTTELTLKFISTPATPPKNDTITGLTKDDIILTSDTVGVTKGTLSGAWPTYKLPITVTASGTLTVTVTKTGYDISGSGKTTDIYYMIPVEFSSLTADGAADIKTTTELYLAFNQVIPGLSASDITLNGVEGVNKGTLGQPVSGAETVTYTLPISGFTRGGTLYVAVAKSGYKFNGSPGSTEIYYVEPTFENYEGTKELRR